MKMPILQRRTLALIAVIVPLLILLGYVALRSGPMAPIAVTEEKVKSQSLRPALFGIGTVDARYTYKIGPIAVGRVKRLDVEVGDAVKTGQLLGEMDPVDLDDRVHAQDAALNRAEATLRDATARHVFAATQAKRYEQLYAVRSTSEEILVSKQQELAIADAALSAAKADLVRIRAELDALRTQRASLRLIAPVDGIVALRDADLGTTVVAGQTVFELLEPRNVWITARLDQISSSGLTRDLPARIQLRSYAEKPLQGKVLRIEPKADAVTEETLVKVTFDTIPSPLPPVGELAEVTIDLPELPASPVIPNAAIQRQGDQLGVWLIRGSSLEFTPVKLGRTDLEGRVQVLQGLKEGDSIIVYSERALTAKSRIRIVERIPGVTR